MDPRLAIICYQPSLCVDPHHAEDEMRRLAERLGFTLADPAVFPIDPYSHGPWTTVGNAITTTGADAVITIDLGHVDGIDKYIRERVILVTYEGEMVLARAEKRTAVPA